MGTGTPFPKVIPFFCRARGTKPHLLHASPNAHFSAAGCRFSPCGVESFLLCGRSGLDQLLLPGVGGERRLPQPTGMRWRVGGARETRRNWAADTIRDGLCRAVISKLTPGPLGPDSYHSWMVTEAKGLVEKPSVGSWRCAPRRSIPTYPRKQLQSSQPSQRPLLPPTAASRQAKLDSKARAPLHSSPSPAPVLSTSAPVLPSPAPGLSQPCLGRLQPCAGPAL